MIPLVLCPNIRTPAERRQLAARGASLRERLAAAGPDRCELVVETVVTNGRPWYSLVLRIRHAPHVGANVANLSDDQHPMPDPAVLPDLHAAVLLVLSRAGRDDPRIKTYRLRAQRVLAVALHDLALGGDDPFHDDSSPIYPTYTGRSLVGPESIRVNGGDRDMLDLTVPEMPEGHLPPVHRLWMYDDDRAIIGAEWVHLAARRTDGYGDPVAMLRLNAGIQADGPLPPLRARGPSPIRAHGHRG